MKDLQYDPLQEQFLQQAAPAEYARLKKHWEAISSCTTMHELVEVNRMLLREYGGDNQHFSRYLDSPFSSGSESIRVNGVPVDVIDNLREVRPELFKEAFGRYQTALFGGCGSETHRLFSDELRRQIGVDAGRLGVDARVGAHVACDGKGQGPHKFYAVVDGRSISSSYMLMDTGKGVSVMLPENWHKGQHTLEKKHVGKFRWREALGGGMFELSSENERSRDLRQTRRTGMRM